MSPDWSAKEEPVPYAKLDNPQSLNLYAYVFNNPLTAVDADGHGCNGATTGFCTPGLLNQISNTGETPKQAMDALAAAQQKGGVSKLASDVVNLAKSAKVSAQVGGSVHMKPTFVLGDLGKSTVGEEVEAGASGWPAPIFRI